MSGSQLLLDFNEEQMTTGRLTGHRGRQREASIDFGLTITVMKMAWL